MKKTYTFFSSLLFVLFGQAQPSVNLSPSSGCAPLSNTISFYDPLATSYEVQIINPNQSWTPIYTTTTINNFINYTFLNGGLYYVSVIGLDQVGSYIGESSTSIDVYGIDNTFYGSSLQGACPGDQVWLSIWTFNQPGGSSLYDWDLGNGTVYTQIPYDYVYSSYPNAGDFPVSVNVQVQGCGNYQLLDTIKVSLTAAVIPYFTSYFYPNDSICPGDELNIYGPNTGYSVYNYGDGTNYSGTSNLPHVYTATGTYYVSVTSINGCGNSFTDLDTIHVVGGLPNSFSSYLDFGMSDTLVCPNTNVSFYSSYPANNLKWNLSPTDSSTASNAQVSFPLPGIYPIKLTTYNGCGSPASIIKNLYVVDTISASPFSLNMTDSICPGSPFMVDFSGYIQQSSNFTYDFGDTIFSGPYRNLLGHIYYSPGTYSVSVSYLNGCGNSASASASIYVGASAGTQHTVFFSLPSGNSGGESSCPGDSTFAIIFPAGGTNIYNIDFGDGSPLVSNGTLLPGPDGLLYSIYRHLYTLAGNYTVTNTVASVCGGSYTDTIHTTVGNSASPNQGDFFWDDTKYYCLGDPITFYAYGASQYEWDFGDATGILQTNGLLQPVVHSYNEPGYYHLRLIVKNSCMLTDTVFANLNVPDTRINISTNSISSSCGVANGKAISIASGGSLPYHYSWTNGDNSFLADSLLSGIYVVNIEDQNGCKNFGIATISDLQAPSILINNVLNVSCNNGADGVIDISVIGSSGPYTFLWSNGKTSEDINNLVAGPYEITVTDANGCVATKSINVTEPNTFVVSFSMTQPACGASNGVIVANILGSTGPYNFIWQNGLNSNTLSGLTAGTYSLVVLDAKGCLKQITTSLSNQGAPAIGIDSIGALDCGSGGASISCTGIGAIPLNYSWTNGTTLYSTADISALAQGSYTLTCTDVNGCSSFKVVDIVESAPISNPICLVTVDTTTYTNKVIWEEVTQPNLASYNIYRESSQAGLYYLAGNVNRDSLHQFIDSVADPSIRAWRYKISSVSDCGTESEKSTLHKTIHLTVNKGLTDSIYNLIWDDYEGQNTYTSFYIWIYKNTTGWVKVDSIAKTDHSYTSFVNGFSSLNALYYFVEAGPLNPCDPTRSIINTSRSNIKQIIQPVPDTSTIGIVKHNYNLESLIIYPNPSKGQITINTGKEICKTKIEVLDIFGQVVYSEELFMSTKNIDMNNLANGVYFVRVRNANKTMSRKVLLNK